MRFRLDVVLGRDAPRVLEIDASDLAGARDRARVLGYTVLDAKGIGSTALSSIRWSTGRTDHFDVSVFVEQLHDLLDAGMSVIEALNTLQRSARRKDRPVLDALVEGLREGQRLSDALAWRPAFPALLVSLVRSSELTSDLPQALSRYLEHSRTVAELRHRLTSLAIYPMMLTGVGMAVLLFLLLYVMPRFARVFEGMGELPWSARVMVWWAQWLGTHGAWLLVLSGACALALVAMLLSADVRTKALRRTLDWAPVRLRLRVYFLAQWYRATGMLVLGGIPLPDAVRLASDVLPVAIQPTGKAVEKLLREGLSPAQAYAKADMATSVAEQLIQAGERTGDLGGVLTRVARFHEADLSRALERTMRSLEPLVMVLIGLGVGVVVVLMYLPIFELAAAIQ